MDHQYKFQVSNNGRAQVWTLWAKSYDEAVNEVYRRLGANGHIVYDMTNLDPNGIDVL